MSYLKLTKILNKILFLLGDSLVADVEVLLALC